MRATLIFAFDVALLLALVNSILRFAFAGVRSRHAAEMRLLAALSSVVTLFAVVAMYGDAFRRATMDAFRAWAGTSGITSTAHDVIVPLDRLTRDAANAVNPGADVGYRPHPSLWPLVLLVIAYVVRMLIYLTLERRRLRSAAATGATYWSHITAYAMVVAFLVEVAGWNPALVIAVSLVLLILFVVGLAGVFEDVAAVAKAGVDVVWHYAHGLAGRLARFFAACARQIRLFFKKAHAVYIAHVRTPLRRTTQRMVVAAEHYDHEAELLLREEDQRHREEFPEDEAPQGGFATQ